MLSFGQFPFTFKNQTFLKCANVGNPSSNIGICKEYFHQRKKSHKLRKDGPHSVTKLTFKTRDFLCWEDPSMLKSLSYMGEFGWCKTDSKSEVNLFEFCVNS